MKTLLVRINQTLLPVSFRHKTATNIPISEKLNYLSTNSFVKQANWGSLDYFSYGNTALSAIELYSVTIK
jgi:hypothetical protein